MTNKNLLGIKKRPITPIIFGSIIAVIVILLGVFFLSYNSKIMIERNLLKKISQSYNSEQIYYNETPGTGQTQSEVFAIFTGNKLKELKSAIEKTGEPCYVRTDYPQGIDCWVVPANSNKVPLVTVNLFTDDTQATLDKADASNYNYPFSDKRASYPTPFTTVSISFIPNRQETQQYNHQVHSLKTKD